MAEMIENRYEQVKKIMNGKNFIFQPSELDGKKHVFYCFAKVLSVKNLNGKTIRIFGTPEEIIDELKRIIGVNS